MSPLFNFGKKDKATKRKFTRIFYATDIHGSEVAFRKFLNAAEFYDTDILILGGDVTGKFMVPVITAQDGTRRVTLHGQRQELRNQQDMDDLKESLGVLGYYYVEMTEVEFQEAQKDESIVDEIFHREKYKRLKEWIELADQRFEGTNTKLYITGGNDDSDDALKALEDYQSAHVIPCEGRHIQIDELHTIVSLGSSNLTPWHTPREYPEEVIADQIVEAIGDLSDFKNVIFNFHVPPLGYGLDMCPELDTSKDPPAPVMHGGEQSFKPAGSSAVRDAVLKYQPLLVLTGHIHESRGTAKIGRTFAVNPGSEYGEGALRGVIVNIGDGEITSWQMTSG